MIGELFVRAGVASAAEMCAMYVTALRGAKEKRICETALWQRKAVRIRELRGKELLVTKNQCDFGVRGKPKAEEPSIRP